MKRHTPTAAAAIALVHYQRQAELARATGWMARAEMFQARIHELQSSLSEGDRVALREAIARVTAREDRVFI